MTQKTFIDKSIEGGWLPKEFDGCDPWIAKRLKENFWEWWNIYMKGRENEILLDPKAWEAVGKIEMWSGEMIYTGKPKLANGEYQNEKNGLQILYAPYDRFPRRRVLNRRIP